MRIRRLWLVLGILLIPTAAFADDHRAGIFPGFSYEKGSKLFGFHWATDITLPRPTSKDLALLLDFSINSGTRDGVDVTRTVYAGGLRWSFARNSPTPRTTTVSWNTVGVHALIGAVRDSSGTDEGTDGFVAFGASYDYIPALRPDGGGWGLRFQADYIVRLGDDADSFPRVSIGAVYRIGRSR